MQLTMKDFFELLPSKEGFERDIPLSESEGLGIHPCGDLDGGNLVHKLLTRERQMITYLEIGGMLRYQSTDRLH